MATTIFLGSIFAKIASGEIEWVDDGRGHYYKVTAQQITKEEYDRELEVENLYDDVINAMKKYEQEEEK